MNNPPEVKIHQLEPKQYPLSSSYFGYKYENILKMRSLTHIKGLKSIHDPGMFNKDERTIEGLKAFFVKVGNKKDIIENYNVALKNNDFYIFPCLETNLKFSVDKIDFTLSIDNKKNIFVNSKALFEKENDYYFIFNEERYESREFKSEKDTLLQIYNTNNCFMILFHTKIEIDGFFKSEESFNIKDYKSEQIICINKEIKNIDKGKYIIYEVKSGGESLSELLKQMVKHYQFIFKYLKVFTRYDPENLIYIGFYRNKNQIENIEALEKSIKGLTTPFIILRYTDTIFGENIYHENVEISSIAELKFLVEENSKKIDKVEKTLTDKIDEIGKDIKDIMDLLKRNQTSNDSTLNQ